MGWFLIDIYITYYNSSSNSRYDVEIKIGKKLEFRKIPPCRFFDQFPKPNCPNFFPYQPIPTAFLIP